MAPKGSEQLFQRKRKKSAEGDEVITAAVSSPSLSPTSLPTIPLESEQIPPFPISSSPPLELSSYPSPTTQPISDIPTARKREVKLLLANKFEIGGKKDPTGWFISEKCTSSSISSSLS